jgi:antitoxin ParD1/3/4
MNVSLTPQLEKLVREKVESGRYNNASEVVREGLRLIEQRDQRLERLRAEMQRGIDQIARGESVVVNDEFFDSIEREVDKELSLEQTVSEAGHAQKVG